MKLYREEFVVLNNQNRPMLGDIRYERLDEPMASAKPIIIFSHGFKGFKDFGCFNLFADEIASRGFAFIKFNYSMNGTTIENPIDFVDLEAFSENTFTQELNDLGNVIDFVCSSDFIQKHRLNSTEIILIGHSMGGGISILKANEDHRIKQLVTLASIIQFGHFWNPDLVEMWRQQGIRYEYNTRTKQQMPLKFSIYEDFLDNADRLDIPAAVKNLAIPFCLIHGSIDETVPVRVTEAFRKLNQSIDIHIISGANHVFGMSQPWSEDEMPPHTKMIAQKTISFLCKK